MFSGIGKLFTKNKEPIVGNFWKKKLVNYIKNNDKIKELERKGLKEEKIKQIFEEISSEINGFMSKQYEENNIINLEPQSDDEKIEMIEKVLVMFDKIPDIELTTSVIATKISGEINDQVIRPAIIEEKENLLKKLDNLRNKEESYNEEFTRLLPYKNKSKTEGGKSKKRNKRNKRRNTHTRRKMKTRK